ncbi:hypothetical protein DAEQUDRAFT_729274 [Daedalea quercina L-15889]|uniref:F-box domain-containing protein n=1 Tax=Daedalea quercina L-15889 TaxID=1314783 RepID=A0A165NQ98_9APHY|nr:hypothetical protein DAEQUDRAFT_729274 [Daedalea quercina L-15889]
MKERNGLRRFPLEIWFSVICQLKDDGRALKACSLTCKEWRIAARPHLWRSLNLIKCDGLRGSRRLRIFLEEHSDLAELVHTLSVSLHHSEVSLLSVFINLTRLAWRHETKYPKDPRNHADIIIISSVTTLVLRFDECPSLQRFERLLSSFPRLSYLDVSTSLSLLGAGLMHRQIRREEPPKSPLILLHLRKLQFHSADLLQSLPRITRSSGTSLTHLFLEVDEMYWIPLGDLQHILDLSQNIRLVELETRMGRFDPWIEGWGVYLAASLSQITPSHTSLRRVVLHVMSPEHRASWPETLAYWSDPGQLLGQELSRVLDELPAVTVVIRQVWSCSESFAQETHESLSHHLLWRFPALGDHSRRLRFVWNLQPSRSSAVGDLRISIHDVPLIRNVASGPDQGR